MVKLSEGRAYDRLNKYYKIMILSDKSTDVRICLINSIHEIAKVLG